ncbi:MAG: hypothetical protein O3A00_24810 [Planctomycetota bacterium]|nr:hypothetical protein [Planctomycetota bacterium]
MLYNGLLDEFQRYNATVTIFTEASQSVEFTREWSRDNVEFRHFDRCDVTPGRSRSVWVRRMLKWLGPRSLLQSYVCWEQSHFYPARPAGLV